jgi:Fe-Mn family superoxide dismutase
MFPPLLSRSARTLIATVAVAFAAAVHAADSPAPFVLDPLPYAVDALEPVMDAETMRLHHDRHHRGYVDKLNARLPAFPELAGMSLEAIQRQISRYDAVVRNNAGGHYNHTLFWRMLAPPGQGGAPDEALSAAIVRDFGSLEAMQRQFDAAAAGVFGSGWAWLILRDDGRLAIVTTPNQDNPLMDLVAERGAPILALDVWEHAYYLKHRNRRADYIAAWWQVMHWKEANRLHAEARRALAAPATETKRP